MIDAGFIEEVQTLLDAGQVSPDSPAMRAVGYRQVVAYLQGDIARSEMIERGIIATRQFAKRQFTWLRSLPADLTLNPYEKDFFLRAEAQISTFVKNN